MKRTSRARRLLAVVLAASAVAAGAGEQDWFPFAMPLDDGVPPAFDLSGLNERPAGAAGWLRAEGERLVDGRGRTVRLLGGNLTAHACFPEPAQAPLLARHFAQTGCNVVRLHFLDNQWGWAGEWMSLLTRENDPVRLGLNPAGLARLNAFVAALKAEGVYVNLNLHVGRSYPGSPDLTQNSKGVDNFMPDMIQGLKDYARLLLTHVNPHTGLAYKDDPAVAILEISNEDSLLLNPWWLEKLPAEYAAVLRRRFNDWLRRRYPDLAALRRAWGVDEGYLGPDVLPAAGLASWWPERHGGSEHEAAAKDDGVVVWTGRKAGSAAWHMQLSSGPLPLRNGQRYEVKIKARSPSGHDLAFSAMQVGDPWANLGLYETFAIGPDWSERAFTFVASGVTTQAGARLVLSLQNHTGLVEVATLSCRPISAGYLKPGESWEGEGIPLPRRTAPLEVRRDFFAFLADVEVSFAAEIKRFLREDLGCRALVAHSQVLFGGPMGARREFLVGDFVDNHGYWHHPSFPNKPWDRRDWRIVNESQIRSWDGGTLAELAMQRPAGRPYAVSEYDLPAPSDYAAEKWPMLAALASFQGWSALYHYTFAHRTEHFGADRITGFFNELGHPAKAGLRPAAAAIFRLGLVSPGRETVLLRVGDDALLEQAARLNGQMWGAWRDLWDREAKLNGALALRHRTGLAIATNRAGAELVGRAPAGMKSPHEADTGEWTWDTERGVFVLRAPAARIWCGALGGADWPAGDAALRVAALDAPAPHATVVLVALDGKPVRESGRLLLTALRRAENEGMAFNADRTSVGDQWGRGPVRVLGLEAELALPPGTAWTVETLDPAGRARERRGEAVQALTISPRDRTIWWLLTRK